MLLFTLSTLTVVGLFFLAAPDGQPARNFPERMARSEPETSGETPLISSEVPPVNELTPTLGTLAAIITLVPTTGTRTPTATSTPTLTPTPGGGEVTTIGLSVEGRPLEVFRFGRGEHSLLIIAGVHGGYEWNTVALADQLIETLKQNPDLVPQDKTLFILRVLNPDGYSRDFGADGRANSNNVDLNRNWDANWRSKWGGTQCWSKRVITAGSEPFSEPETRALRDFILAYQVEQIINYHSAGLGIFAGGVDDRNSVDLARVLERVSPYAYPPIETDCQFTGQLVDWAASHGIAAVDIELRNHTDTDFEINLEILSVFLGWEPQE